MERTEPRLRRFLWVLPAVWLVHGLEEWNQGAHYRAHWINAEDLTDTGIRAWLLAMGALGFVWTFAATRFRNDRVAVGLVLLFFVVQGFANTLQHVYWIGLLGVWSPGTATALVLVMPAIVWASVRALREKLARGWYLLLLYAAAIPIMVVTVQMRNEMPEGGLPFYRFASDLFS